MSWRPDSHEVATRIGTALQVGLTHGPGKGSSEFVGLLADFPPGTQDRDIAAHVYAIANALMAAIFAVDPAMAGDGSGLAWTEYGQPIEGSGDLDPSDAPEWLALIAAMMPAYANGDTDGLLRVFYSAEANDAIRATHELYLIAVAVLRHEAEAHA